MQKKTLTNPYHLIDLTQVSDEELQKYLWFGTMALALKHIHDSNLLTAIEGVFQAVKELEKYGAESYIYTIVSYIAEAGEISHQEEWREAMKNLESTNQDKPMTLRALIDRDRVEIMRIMAKIYKAEAREEAREESRQEGHEEGRQEGHEEGRKAEKIEIAKALLMQGIDLETIAKATGLPKEKIQKTLS